MLTSGLSGHVTRSADPLLHQIYSVCACCTRLLLSSALTFSMLLWWFLAYRTRYQRRAIRKPPSPSASILDHTPQLLTTAACAMCCLLLECFAGGCRHTQVCLRSGLDKLISTSLCDAQQPSRGKSRSGSTFCGAFFLLPSSST